MHCGSVQRCFSNWSGQSYSRGFMAVWWGKRLSQVKQTITSKYRINTVGKRAVGKNAKLMVILLYTLKLHRHPTFQDVRWLNLQCLHKLQGPEQVLDAWALSSDTSPPSWFSTAQLPKNIFLLYCVLLQLDLPNDLKAHWEQDYGLCIPLTCYGSYELPGAATIRILNTDKSKWKSTN